MTEATTPEAAEPGVDIEKQGSVATVTLRNPAKRNAFTRQMRYDLTSGLDALMRDEEVRVIVLRGDGEHFSSGADVSGGKPPVWTLIQHRANNKELNDLAGLFAASPKPVIAAVEGIAVGGAMGFAVACDVVVASKKARFIPLFTKLGIVPEMGILHTLAMRIGGTRAKRLLMSSRNVEGPEAFEIGLADELVEPGQAYARALEIAHEFDDCSPLAVAIVKEAYANGIPSMAEAGRIEVDFVPLLVRTEDTREGFASAREKRKPKFTGN